ncbi:hypothetical protein EDC01DRAFT_261780 [Geopyxis carbonaria]|nr:hypothetical protein EDC01DRAFT_261780 [Geopyxis carbonaria]
MFRSRLCPNKPHDLRWYVCSRRHPHDHRMIASRETMWGKPGLAKPRTHTPRRLSCGPCSVFPSVVASPPPPPPSPSIATTSTTTTTTTTTIPDARDTTHVTMATAYADLASLHSHYQALLATERSLWDAERALYLQRIAALEAHVTAAGVGPLPTAPPPPPNTTNTTSSGATTNGESAVEDDEDDDDDEISQKEMGLLLLEAKRVVGASNGPKGRTPVAELGSVVHHEDEHEHDHDHDHDHDMRRAQQPRPKMKEEVVELKLRKTSNFGVEFGRAWR